MTIQQALEECLDEHGGPTVPDVVRHPYIINPSYRDKDYKTEVDVTPEKQRQLPDSNNQLSQLSPSSPSSTAPRLPTNALGWIQPSSLGRLFSSGGGAIRAGDASFREESQDLVYCDGLDVK